MGPDSASHAPERKQAALVNQQGKPESYYFSAADELHGQ